MLLLIKTTFFSLLLMGTSAEKRQDKCHESMSFHPVLKAYPTWHSWIIIPHIPLGDLNRQLCMFNCQKTSAHQLLVKLQGQLLASNFVLNAHLGEFSNMNSIYESYKPLKTES